MSKFPPEHYPVSEVQHIRAVTALTISRICLEIYSGKEDFNLNKINRCISSCSSLTRKKKLSEKAKRDMNNCSIVISEYIEAARNKTGKMFMRAWAELIWAALTYIEDVIATCPQYTVGNEKKKWQKLCNIMEDLAEKLRIQIPKIDENGTYIYERSAWALEGVNYMPPDGYTKYV